MRIKLLFLLFLISGFLFAQQEEIQHATFIGKSEKMVEAASIASQVASGTFVPAEDLNREFNPKKRDANIAVPGKGLPNGVDPLWEQQRQSTMIKGPEPILTFTAASAYSTPTDPSGAVGPNHYVHAWNVAFRIFDKQGEPLTDPASLGTLWPGETAGDPIVFYDRFADRFIVTQFTFKDGFLVAVSQGPDPVNDGWYTYEFLVDAFPDYPKFSVWSDAYYITANKNSNTAQTSEVVFALERDSLLAGSPEARILGFPLPDIITSGFYSPLGFNANGEALPPPGNAPIVYMQDDVWSGVDSDHLKIWSLNVDWETPENSTISDPQLIYTEPFDGLFDGGSFSNLPQPDGPDLDALQATIMYMAQYRRFPGYNTVVFNFVVDLDGNDDYSGIRWYELRQDEDGDPWEIYQEGTYAQPTGHSAYAGTMCMDVDGNIGLSYSVVSSELNPAIRYTGRFASDPLGTMTIEEQVIVNGTQSDPSFRYGDYSQMTIDPNDDKTFWTTAEYFAESMRKNQVGVFKIAPNFNVDAGVISIDAPSSGLLTEADTVKITVRNFGIDSLFNIPVSYRIDSGEVVTEIITDTIYSATNLTFAFAATADFSEVGHTYEVTAWTEFEGDEDNSNDTVTTFITHLYPNDIGVDQMLSPVSGFNLTDAETVSVLLRNYGGLPQTDFDISFVLDDSIVVQETVTDTLFPGSTLVFAFDSACNMQNIGSYMFSCYTSLDGDSDMGNDSAFAVITHDICQPFIDCTEGDGVARFQLGNIDNISGCDPNGYGDYMDMVADIEMGPYNDMIITTFYGDQHIKVWIDYNDNFVFDTNEVVIDNYVLAEGQASGEYVETLLLDIPYDITLGEHLLRIKTNWNNPVPDDACEATMYGETEDYTVNIGQTTAVGQQLMETNDLVISTSGDNRFTVSYVPVNTRETLIVTVHNITGQKMIQNRVPYVHGKYEFSFDMSHARPGMYLVKLGSAEFGKVKKIIVR